jgi:hypothetical protein
MGKRHSIFLDRAVYGGAWLLLAGFCLTCLPGTASGQAVFDDRSALSGINNTGSNHGVSFGDYNNDGLEDIYVAIRDDDTPNRLYRNQGGNTFKEMSVTARVAAMDESACAVWGDLNNDGWLDLYLGNFGSNKLFLNNGDETFDDITAGAQVGDDGLAYSVQFADVDGDGLLDIYVHNFNAENVLYRNNGDLTFTDVTVSSGATDTGPAMGTVFFDYDNDGDLDLYLLNDGSTNVLYANDGNGVFENVSEQAGLDLYCSCMGVDVSDFNRDGYLDLYITDFGTNILYRNNGDGSFTEMANELGVDDYGMGWGTSWLDYDNDGFQDLYLANNYVVSSRPNVLYRNNEGNSFTPVSQATDLEAPYPSFGTASADINNDGWMDIFVANWGASGGNQLFLNEGEGNHSIKIRAVGTASNRSAIGTVVTIRTGDIVQTDQVTGATGYAGQNSLLLHFGTGQSEIIDEMRVRWPSGVEETFTDIPVDRLLTVTEMEGIAVQSFDGITTSTVENDWFESAVHYPNPFSDQVIISFQLERAQPVQLDIFTPDGRKVRGIERLQMPRGKQHLIWDGKDAQGNTVDNGLYVYQLKLPGISRIWTDKVYLHRR